AAERPGSPPRRATRFRLLPVSPDDAWITGDAWVGVPSAANRRGLPATARGSPAGGRAATGKRSRGASAGSSAAVAEARGRAARAGAASSREGVAGARALGGAGVGEGHAAG